MSTLSQLSVPYRIVLAQLVVGVVVSVIACGYSLIFSQANAGETAVIAKGLATEEGFAAALGALIVVLPNAWLAWRITGQGAAGASEQSAARILALSLTKFLTTAGAAALALAMIKPALAGFLAGLVATVLTAALVPPFLAPQQLARTPRLD